MIFYGRLGGPKKKVPLVKVVSMVDRYPQKKIWTSDVSQYALAKNHFFIGEPPVGLYMKPIVYLVQEPSSG